MTMTELVAKTKVAVLIKKHPKNKTPLQNKSQSTYVHSFNLPVCPIHFHPASEPLHFC